MSVLPVDARELAAVLNALWAQLSLSGMTADITEIITAYAVPGLRPIVIDYGAEQARIGFACAGAGATELVGDASAAPTATTPAAAALAAAASNVCHHFPCVLGRPRSRMLTSIDAVYAGVGARSKRGILTLRYPFKTEHLVVEYRYTQHSVLTAGPAGGPAQYGTYDDVEVMLRYGMQQKLGAHFGYAVQQPIIAVDRYVGGASAADVDTAARAAARPTDPTLAGAAAAREAEVVATSPVVLVTNTAWPAEVRAHLVGVLFGSFPRLPAVALVSQAEAALFACGGRRTGISVHFGATETSATLVYEGQCVPHSRVSLPFGGADVVDLFMSLTCDDGAPAGGVGWSLTTSAERDEARQAVLWAAYVPTGSANDEHAVHTAAGAAPETAADRDQYRAVGDLRYTLSDGIWRVIGTARFLVGAAYFEPLLFYSAARPAGVDAATSGVQSLVQRCLQASPQVFDADHRELLATLCANVVVSGGASRIRGMTDRLQTELRRRHNSAEVATAATSPASAATAAADAKAAPAAATGAVAIPLPPITVLTTEPVKVRANGEVRHGSWEEMYGGPATACWSGAAALSTASAGFASRYVTREEWSAYGADVVQRKCA